MKLPTPADAYCSFPGRSLAIAMRSLTDLSGRSGWIEITFGAVASERDRRERFFRIVR